MIESAQQFCYEVKDWNSHFENSESRRYKSLTWVPVKNKHDGKGYRRVVQHPKSVQVFCAWNLIIQVASKMPTRGLLRDEDGPLTTSDLSFKTGFPESIFEVAFEVLTDAKIGWLVKVPGARPQIPADAQQNPVNRTEQNRTEQKERESGARSVESFAETPSWGEWWAYCQGPECNLVAEWFARDKFLAAEASNWERNRNWRAYARRCQKWWESDGRPMSAPQKKSDNSTKPKAKFLL